MYDISLTIVAYRNYKDIVEAVRSIEENTSTEIDKKIYIVDNSCYEETNEERKAFENVILKYNDIEYVNVGKNIGFGAGHNYVLDKIDSRYHGIINPDILITEDSLTKLIRFMKSNHIRACVPKLINQEGTMIKAYRRELTFGDMFIRMFCPGLFKKRKAYHTMDDMDYTKPFNVPFAQGSFLIVETELLKELDGFDDRFFMYMEDADLCKRINKITHVVYFPDTCVIHKWEKGSHKSIKLFRIHVKSMIKYFLKWK